MGESSLSFREAFESPLVNCHRLLAMDLPGFGVSPRQLGGLTIDSAADLLHSIIIEISKNASLVFVAHSMGSLIASRLCQCMDARVRLFISVEGNLTQDDTFFSAKALQFDSPAAFYAALIESVMALTIRGDAFQRYYASLRFADPLSIWTLARSGAEATGQTAAGLEFQALSCPKLYYWGDQSTPCATQEFIRLKKLPIRCFRGAGHWPMVEVPDIFYAAVLRDLPFAPDGL
jgi:pimeloyl-ACP methyl ester carboxylesterase